MSVFPMSSTRASRRCASTLFLCTLVAGCSAQKSGSDVSMSENETRSAEASQEPSAPAETSVDAIERDRDGEAGSGTGPQGPQVLLGAASTSRGKMLATRGAAPDRGLLVAIDSPYQIFSQQGSYVHVAAWTIEGKPARQADVFIGNTHVGKTDEHGSIVFQHPPKGSKPGSAPQGGVVTVVDAQDGSIQGSVPFQPNVRTASFASDHLFVYADRGVYKPGDAVKVRVIGWHLKDDYAPLVERDVEVLLRDTDGKQIGGAKRTTDEFGVTSMELPIPLTAKEGLYTLEVAYAQARQTARLQVRDFKPPSVVIAHDLPRFLTADQESLSTRVTLTRAQGGDFGSGKLTLRAKSNGRQIFETTRRVKGSGPHTFTLEGSTLDDIKGALSTGQWLNLELEVLDARGSKDRVVREVRYTDNPYVAVIELDKDQYSTDDDVEVIAKVRDLDGVPVRNKPVELRYAGRTIEAKSDDSGTAQFSLTMPATSINMSLYLEGVDKPVARTTARWVEPRAMVSHIKDPIIKERQTARVKVKFPAHIKPVEQVVHMDVVDTSGAIVNAVLLPISETSEGFVAQGEFTSPSWGSMLLTFFALGAHEGATLDGSTPHHRIGLMTEGQNLVVNPDRELTITLDGIPDEVSPGAHIDIKARVLDHRGILTSAELGAAVVDQRIMSLKDPLEITPMDHFYEPTLRTMSTTGSKILSWPVVSRNWGGRQRDVALPPFPFLEGGALTHQGGPTAAMESMDLEEKAMGGSAEPPAEPEPEPSKSYGAKPKKKLSKKSASGKSMSIASGEAQLMGGSASTISSKREEGRADRPAPGKPAAQITIRTRFEETSTWRPHMRTEGETTLGLDLPDAIAKQELVVVASDKKGAVGIARKTIDVSQGLFAQADFPASLHVGEQVTVPVLVQNNTSKAQDVVLEMSSEVLEVAQQDRIELEPNSSRVVAVRVRAKSAGELPYKLSVKGAGLEDVVMGTARVRPTGATSTTRSGGKVTGSKRFTHVITVPDEATQAQAWISLAPPIITTATSGMLEMEQTLRERPLLVASDLASAAMILRYAQRHGLKSAQLDELRTRVLSATSTLQVAQRPDGSFGYWRNGVSSPYVTAWALEGMLEALELDVPVPQDAIEMASKYLVEHHQDDALVSTEEIAFWEGDSAQVRIGISAEIFDVLSRVPTSMQSDAHRAFLKSQGERFKKYLEANTLDPLTAGRVVQAMLREEALPVIEARAVIDKLRAMRDRTHWEPSWFHAYGGRIEATTAMIGAMVATDPQGYAAEIRDALNWVLSTRGAWGQWHNERGTTSALRALMMLPPREDVTGGELVISVDGKEIERVRLDASDPFMSAPQLGHITLGSALAPGKHTVEVEYTGKMEIPVQVYMQTRERAVAKTGSVRELSASVSGKRDLDITQSTMMSLRAEPGAARRPMQIRIAPSGLLDVNLSGLDELVEKTAGLVDWQMRDGEIIMETDATFAPTTLEIPVTAVRAGEGDWPTVVLEETGLAPGSERLHVSAGKIEVK